MTDSVFEEATAHIKSNPFIKRTILKTICWQSPQITQWLGRLPTGRQPYNTKDRRTSAAPPLVRPSKSPRPRVLFLLFTQHRKDKHLSSVGTGGSRVA